MQTIINFSSRSSRFWLPSYPCLNQCNTDDQVSHFNTYFINNKLFSVKAEDIPTHNYLINYQGFSELSFECGNTIRCVRHDFFSCCSSFVHDIGNRIQGSISLMKDRKLLETIENYSISKCGKKKTNKAYIEIKSSHGKFFCSQQPEVPYFLTFLKQEQKQTKRQTASLNTCFFVLFFSYFFSPLNNSITENTVQLIL